MKFFVASSVLLWALSAAAFAGVDYGREVKPLLASACVQCHGANNPKSGLRLDTAASILKGGESGAAVVRGRADESLLVALLKGAHGEIPAMPYKRNPLGDSQVELIKRWINEGARAPENEVPSRWMHWSFGAPMRSNGSEMSMQQGGGHPIDRFIDVALAEQGIEASPLAESATLVRRLHLDLTGLPPTLAEAQKFERAFENEGGRDLAVGQLVDRLLASPHYGERWGRWWLDQARYADSNGYSIDARRSIWPYRDWVVKALNDDMQFDQFTIEQIAGDLLPDAPTSAIVASGFHRNTQINGEGGIDPEQFRIESVYDRVATTGTVWLGLTIACAQCHDHKFDPISQKEYFELFAFFNSTETDGHGGTKSAVHELVGEPFQKEAGKKKAVTTLIMKELPEPRETRLFIKGDFTRPDELVTPGTPQVLPALVSRSAKPDRLDLARWLVDRNNPLTARVIVNRVWQVYFGRGLVETENDFGVQSSAPTHPELLDWLAVEFMESGWSLKHMHRLIVTSDVYLRSSKARPELHLKDPGNLLLARQNRLRLDAELVRDVSLASTGLLNPKLGGPPVYPPQSAEAMKGGQITRAWPTSKGADRYRRGLYTFFYRSTPPPSMMVFDSPDSLTACTRRARSNTPLQALTLLNDPAYFEFAEAMGEVVRTEGVGSAFRRAVTRQPLPQELSRLEGLDALTIGRVLLNLDETITRE